MGRREGGGCGQNCLPDGGSPGDGMWLDAAPCHHIPDSGLRPLHSGNSPDLAGAGSVGEGTSGV